MAEVEQDILDAGAQIIWVLEQDPDFKPGTAELCVDTMTYFESKRGWCVGDDQTQPEPGTFDDSPFAEGRGFDILVDPKDMVIWFNSNHGTPAGNENLTGQDILDVIRGGRL